MSIDTELVASASARALLPSRNLPDLSELLAILTPKGSSHPFDKAMVVGLHIGPNGDHSRLRFVLDPRALKLDPDHRGSGL